MNGPLPELSPARWLPALDTELLGRIHELHAELPSTMDRARARADVPGLVILAETQSAGRGTHGRSWVSPAGDDLYLSFVWRPEVSSRQLPSITLAAGLAVAELVEGLLAATLERPPPVEIRWPNDVMVDGAKIAGILVESRVSASGGAPALIVGVGLNVNRQTFPPELVATSLARELGRRCDRAEVLAALLNGLERRLRAWEREGSVLVARDIAPRLRHHGQLVDVDGARGRLRGVDVDGALLLDPVDGGAPLRVVAGRPLPITR